MTSAIGTDIGYARLTVFSDSSNLLENWSNQFISFFLAARHDRRTFKGPFFTAGHAGSDEVKTFSRKLTITTNRILEEGVTTINDDVTFVQVRLQRVDGTISACARLHH
ncbi:Uncharacterised protein [Klebsiella michiganensis]|nr:Uncharacterised protein [Klebsiella michiganensis]